jgi:cellobiose-specific phosphotransferase system component IIA
LKTDEEKMMQKGKHIIAAVAAALVLGTVSAQAGSKTFDGYKVGYGASIQDYWNYSDMPDSESLTQMRSSINAALESHRQRMRQAPKEVVDGLNYTAKALKAMKKGDTKVARMSLEAATKLFNIALTNNPALDMVPVADSVEINDLVITPAEVSAAIKDAETALKEHHTQKARMLLMPLHEQMSIETQLLPMALYPDATKLALSKLKQGDKAGAIAALHDGFEAMVTEEEVLPLPLLKAQAFADAASGLEKSRKKEALVLIAHAQDELENAVLLGYTAPDDVDYKMVKDQMAKVEKAVGVGKNSKNLFEELMHDFDALFKKPQNGWHKVS